MTPFQVHHWIAIGVLLATSAFQETRAAADAKEGSVVRMLDEKRVKLQDMSVPAKTAVEVLRQKYHVPISFISVAGDEQRPVKLRNGETTLREALDEFVRDRDAYTYNVVRGRLVVLPRSGPFTDVISGMEITNSPRLEAMVAFVHHLNELSPAFANLIPPGILGNPEAPLFTERVSGLKGRGTIVEHLAALLGDNPDVVFSIVDGPRPSTRLFVLEQVRSSEK